MPDNTIEVRVEDISQLFHTLDPFPFRERDLDRDAEEFIVSWARDLPESATVHILVYLSRAGFTSATCPRNSAWNQPAFCPSCRTSCI